MNIQNQIEQVYCSPTNDTKNGLDQLAKYYKTTKTNLIEEGAQMVIRSRLNKFTLIFTMPDKLVL